MTYSESTTPDETNHIDHPQSVTMADVLARIVGDESLDKRYRADLASALRTLSKVIGRPAAEIPASGKLVCAMVSS